MRRPYAARVIVLIYVIALVGVPVGLIFQRLFAPGWHAILHALADPQMDAAAKLTGRVALVAVPLNAMFGLGASLWIVRRPGRLSRLLDAVIDVPLAVSPIIIGLILELAYASNGWFGRPLAAMGLQVIFSYWGIVLASAFVSLPLVSRQVIPLLRELGVEPEQTAATLGASRARAFLTVTLPSIKWALAYGVTLSLARVIGEYGAVLIVSGNIALLTQTLTLNIGSNFDNFNSYQGFVGAALLAAVSIVVLLILGVLRHRDRRLHERHA